MNKRKSDISLPKTFLIFIIISLFFWFLTKLSKEYKGVIQLATTYQELPLDKIVKNKLPETLDVTINATGFKILYAQLITPKISLDISDAKENETNSYIFNLTELKSKIQNQLSNQITIEYFEKPRIKIEFDQLDSKKIKIESNVSITYKDNFDAYGKEIINPDSILVSGPKSILDTLKSLNTEFLQLEDVEKNISQQLKVQSIYKEKRIVYESNAIDFSVNVTKFTEATLEIPFTIINKPKNQNITTFPNLVKLTFKIGLSDYEKINKDLFKVECNFEESLKNNLNFLIPKVTSYPKFVKGLHLRTQKIDFFITK